MIDDLWGESWWNGMDAISYDGGGGGGGYIPDTGIPTFSVTGTDYLPPDISPDFSSWGVPDLFGNWNDVPSYGGAYSWDPLTDYSGGPGCNCGGSVPYVGSGGSGGSTRPPSTGSGGGAPSGGQQRPPQQQPKPGSNPWLLIALIGLVIYAAKNK